MATAEPASPVKTLAVHVRNLPQNCRRRILDGGRWLMGRPHLVEAPDGAAFQSDIEAIIAEPAPRLMRSIHYIILALILSLILIASLKKVEVIVTSSGRLITDAPTIVLQAMDQAIIRELKVVEGNVVAKGQVLATMDPTFTQADLTSLSVQQQSLLAKVEGLEAELVTISSDMKNRVTGREASLPEALYRQRIIQYRSRLRVFDQEILRLQANIHSTESDRASLAKQLDNARVVEGMRSSLMQSQAGSMLQYLDAKAFRMRTEQSHQNANDHLTELYHTVDAKQAERQAFCDEWYRQTLESLVTARTELAKVREALVKASRMNELVVITAPEDSVVTAVAKLSVGSVLRAAEPLMTLLPSSATLVADITINSKDIGYTKPGDEVIIKVDAFPYSRHGQLHGRLLWVSEESFQTGEPGGRDGSLPMSGRSANAVHRGRVSLLDSKLRNLPKGIQPIPGMTLSADIIVGSRSVISYILYPLARAFNESIREP